MDETIKKTLEAPQINPEGCPVAWEDPFLRFLAEYGRIPAGETEATQGKLIFLPEPPQPVLLEFFAYQTISCIAPGT